MYYFGDFPPPPSLKLLCSKHEVSEASFQHTLNQVLAHRTWILRHFNSWISEFFTVTPPIVWYIVWCVLFLSLFSSIKFLLLGILRVWDWQHIFNKYFTTKKNKNLVLEQNIKLVYFTTTLHISNNTTIKNLTFSTCSFPNAIYFIHQMLYLSYVNKTKNQNQASFIIFVPNRRILNNHLQSPEPESEILETGECLTTQVYKKLVSGHLQFFYKQTTGQGRNARGKAWLELTGSY